MSGVEAPARVGGTVRVASAAELVALFEPEVGAATLTRAPCSEITRYLDAAVVAGTLASASLVLRPGSDGIVPILPSGAGREALDRDVRVLGELFADLVGCPRVGVRLEVLDRAMCPRFHADRVALRLLCTYRGPGSEWIEPGGAVVTAAPFEVLLLKGDLWPGRSGGGVLHRSPTVAPADAPRVLLAIDALW